MTIYAKSGTTIHIGRVGENLATDVVFDISPWIQEYGEGTAELVINQNSETYPQYTTRENNLIKWKVTNSNTTDAGMGKCELFYLVNEIKVKSAIYDFIVTNSLDYEEGAEPPAAFESWVEEVIENAVYIKENIERAEENADEAEAWAVGTKNGEPVLIDELQYENNALHYATIARTEAGNAADNAAAADSSAKLSQQWAEGTFEDGSKSAKEWSTESQDWKLESEAFAIGERNGTPVTETDETFENNAKYYRDKAQAERTAAETAQKAATDAQTAAESAAKSAGEAQKAAETAQGDAETAQGKAEAAQGAAETAQEAAETAERETKGAKDEVITIKNDIILINSNPPYMNTESGNWMVWNKEEQKYKDSGVKFSLSITTSFPSTDEMNKAVGDFKNGDLVIIASDISDPDNSKLFVHNGTEWIYLSDLSGFQGVGIREIKKTAGTGDQGTTDTYTVFLTDNRTYDFTVYNGADGDGAGDMLASTYDKNGKVADAGGIEGYVEQYSSKVLLKSWTKADLNP